MALLALSRYAALTASSTSTDSVNVLISAGRSSQRVTVNLANALSVQTVQVHYIICRLLSILIILT